MQKWIVSILAGIAGIAVGLALSDNFLVARLYLDGVEVDLTDATAVSWALANPKKAEWFTYVTVNAQDILVLPGSYWSGLVPAAVALVFFCITFLLLDRPAKSELPAKSANPFQKAGPLAQDRKAARLAGEAIADAALIDEDAHEANGVDKKRQGAKDEKVEEEAETADGEENADKDTKGAKDTKDAEDTKATAEDDGETKDPQADATEDKASKTEGDTAKDAKSEDTKADETKAEDGDAKDAKAEDAETKEKDAEAKDAEAKDAEAKDDETEKVGAKNGKFRALKAAAVDAVEKAETPNGHKTRASRRRKAARKPAAKAKRSAKPEAVSAKTEAAKDPEKETPAKAATNNAKDATNTAGADTTTEAATKDAVKDAVVEALAEAAADAKAVQPEPASEDAAVLEDEVWQTHYDYDDKVRKTFDELKGRGEHLGIEFARLFMENPKAADLEALAKQVLEKEKARKRFSDNEKIETAHADMREISEEAAAEFRRVIGILGEAADLTAVTRKIRRRFPNKDAKASSLDPSQMNESQIIRELRSMGYEIIAPSGGPYPVKSLNGDRITKPFTFIELQEFLKEKRSQ